MGGQIQWLCPHHREHPSTFVSEEFWEEKWRDPIHVLKEFSDCPGKVGGGWPRVEAGSSVGSLLQGSRQELLAWTVAWRWWEKWPYFGYVLKVKELADQLDSGVRNRGMKNDLRFLTETGRIDLVLWWERREWRLEWKFSRSLLWCYYVTVMLCHSIFYPILKWRCPVGYRLCRYGLELSA